MDPTAYRSGGQQMDEMARDAIASLPTVDRDRNLSDLRVAFRVVPGAANRPPVRQQRRGGQASAAVHVGQSGKLPVAEEAGPNGLSVSLRDRAAQFGDIGWPDRPDETLRPSRSAMARDNHDGTSGGSEVVAKAIGRRHCLFMVHTS